MRYVFQEFDNYSPHREVRLTEEQLDSRLARVAGSPRGPKDRRNILFAQVPAPVDEWETWVEEMCSDIERQHTIRGVTEAFVEGLRRMPRPKVITDEIEHYTDHDKF